MKRINCLLICLSSTAFFAQTKNTIEFNKKLMYKIETTDSSYQSEYKGYVYSQYLAKDNSKVSLLSFYTTENTGYGSSESNTIVSNNWFLPITVSGISGEVSTNTYSAFKLLGEGKTIAKLNRKGAFGTFNCQYYAVLSEGQTIEDETGYTCLCIDEANKINNASILFPQSKLKGLVVSVEPDGRDLKVIYDKQETTALKFNLDIAKEISAIEEYQTQNATDTVYAEEEAVTEYVEANEVYNDPLYSVQYEYGDDYDYAIYQYLSAVNGITSSALYNAKEYNAEGTLNRDQIVKFYDKETKSLIKNLASTKLINSDQKKLITNLVKEQNKRIKRFKPGEIVEETAYAVDSVAYATDAAADTAYATTDAADLYAYYTKYESSYHNENIDEVSLAFDGLYDEQLKENAPKYCDDLQNKVPDFQNKTLKKHVHNYAGQICDLYLYNNGGNVGYFETINSMRKSLLEIENLRKDLSQKDQKLLLEFLKSLD